MRILVLGADGYLGWPTAMHLAARGHHVVGVDSYLKRELEASCGVKPLDTVLRAADRAQLFSKKTGYTLEFLEDDISELGRCRALVSMARPDAIVHYAEQPSAPFSMMTAATAELTQRNNVLGTLNLLWAIREQRPDAHLVKLGTMGEYGTPNIDIEDGWLDVEHNGRKDRVLFPKRPGSFYHLSKVHDSHNIEFACRTWGLAATDLNQGVVYGTYTPEMELIKDGELGTSFHYDAIFGTALNRFCTQAVAGQPITVYGSGNQERAFLNIVDTLQCVTLAVENPAAAGEFRVMNQFTEKFSILALAACVQQNATDYGMTAAIQHLENPRVESEDHYYNPKNDAFLELGLSPHYLGGDVIQSMFRYIEKRAARIDPAVLNPKVSWVP